ncbi:MAG TPA: magnesium transporter [Gallionella sp.]|nr:magnesium transporter [Gallionella sp.]
MTQSEQEPHFAANLKAALPHIQYLLEDDSHAAAGAQHRLELQHKLERMHPADIADILEALPVGQRLLAWSLVAPERGGKILLEVSDAVRESLIGSMNRAALRAAAMQLDTGEIARLARHLPQGVLRDIFKSRSIEKREQLRSAMSYPENTVGALMDFNMVRVRDDVTLKTVARYLRRFDALPGHIDQVFVTDRDERFKGVLPLKLIVAHPPETLVGALMIADTTKLNPEQLADQAEKTFERYELVSAPVVDEEGKLVGRVSVDTVLRYLRTKSEHALLNQAGLRDKEDTFASALSSMQNRWGWLALNLCGAFLASRVIGGFENTIGKYATLAALLPVVAIVSANAATQTGVIVTRALALEQLGQEDMRRLLSREMTGSGLSGLVWGSIAGLFAYLVYHSVALGIVTTVATMLNLMLGAGIGIAVPLAMRKLGHIPATACGALIAALSSSGSFFIFLGLATIFLVR